jgi:hypothetical protein
VNARSLWPEGIPQGLELRGLGRTIVSVKPITVPAIHRHALSLRLLNLLK